MIGFYFVKLRSGVDPRHYERWLVERDYPFAQTLPSVVRYRSNRLEGRLKGSEVAHDYIEEIEFTNLEDFQRDLDGEAIQPMRREAERFIEPSSCYWCRPVEAGPATV